MPLRCINHKRENIQSSYLSDDEWFQLKYENKKSNNLKMPCCNADVVLKQSRLGTRFFAHKSKGTCLTSPETKEHLYLKDTVLKLARKSGWKAQSEVTGKTPSGEEWRADILAMKGKYKVAIEIQWSNQTNEETFIRLERYKKSGIRCLWLFRQPGFPITKDLPAVCIGGDLKEGFSTLIPCSSDFMTARSKKIKNAWHKILPIHEFLNAVFNEKFQYGIPKNTNIDVTIKTQKQRCPWCKNQTNLIFPIVLQFPKKLKVNWYGPDPYTSSDKMFVDLHFFDNHKNILDSIIDKIPKNTLKNFGQIKLRHNGDNYPETLSNGCLHCDKIIFGNRPYFSKFQRVDNIPGFKSERETTEFVKNPIIKEFTIKVSEDWQELLNHYWGEHWDII